MTSLDLHEHWPDVRDDFVDHENRELEFQVDDIRVEYHVFKAPMPPSVNESEQFLAKVSQNNTDFRHGNIAPVIVNVPTRPAFPLWLQITFVMTIVVVAVSLIVGLICAALSLDFGFLVSGGFTVMGIAALITVGQKARTYIMPA